MPNHLKISEFENSIKKNKKIIQKKKKSIPYVLLLLLCIYTGLFHINAAKLTNLFDNQLDFITRISYIFASLTILYASYVLLLVSRLSRQSKHLNTSIYQLAKLDDSLL